MTPDADDVRRALEELRASRTRLARRADAASRRIERDLHDGVQQHLVALCVNLQLAEQLLDADPPAARALLSDIADDVREALESVRELAAGIYPPLLIDRGLGEALRGAASAAGVSTQLEVEVSAHYAPDIEAAVYFSCVGALRNVAEHAGPRARASIRVWEEKGNLRFEVSDDGSGFELSATQLGDGLTHIKDIVGALGGELTISSEPAHGTRVSAAIPLRP